MRFIKTLRTIARYTSLLGFLLTLPYCSLSKKSPTEPTNPYSPTKVYVLTDLAGTWVGTAIISSFVHPITAWFDSIGNLKGINHTSLDSFSALLLEAPENFYGTGNFEGNAVDYEFFYLRYNKDRL